MKAPEPDGTRDRNARLHRNLRLAALVACVYPFLLNLYQYVRYLPGHPEVSDFRAFYAASRVGLAHGWGAVYDSGELMLAIQASWPGSRFVAFLNPPPLAWLFVPVGLVPAGPAFFVWAAFSALLLSLCALVASPTHPVARVAGLLSALAFLPSYTVLTYGMVTPLVMVGLIACWSLLEQHRELAAGVVLSVLAVKPHVALMVPPALLLAGYRRCFLAWTVATAVLALASLAAIGPTGAASWLHGLRQVSLDPFLARYSIGDIVGGGPLGWALRVVVLALALAAAWLWRARGAQFAISAGVAASLVASSHITPGDFVLLLVPVWLLLRSSPPLEVSLLLGALWFAGWLAPGPPLPAVAGCLVLLALLAGYGAQGGRWRPIPMLPEPARRSGRPAAFALGGLDGSPDPLR